ncbi:hypothetical protein ACQ86G_06835 [Roseateles chitinivorans]|uniref:hypothetical protein n=1 Tax=Roseateles chitinivorans TaxID=2917965 RepID=UPI003D667732
MECLSRDPEVSEMKYRSPQTPSQLPRASSRPYAGSAGADSELPSHYGESRFSHGLSRYSDSGSSFGDSDFGAEPPPRRSLPGPVESWHDSSFILRRGLEVREVSAKEWRVWAEAPSAWSSVSTPSDPMTPRRRMNGDGTA